MIGRGFAAAAAALQGIGARLALWGCIALILVGMGAGTTWYLLSDTIAGLEAERKDLQTHLERAASARRAERVASEKRAVVRTQRAAASAAHAAKDAAAIDVNRAWADQPLPKEVRDALAE